jgi:hypothetical protein
MTAITTITITITTPPPIAPIPTPRPNTRGHHLIALITATPGQTWTGRDLATLTGASLKVALSQLAEWTRAGYLTRTSPGTYKLKLNTPANPASSTTAPGP